MKFDNGKIFTCLSFFHKALFCAAVARPHCIAVAHCVEFKNHSFHDPTNITEEVRYSPNFKSRTKYYVFPSADNSLWLQCQQPFLHPLGQLIKLFSQLLLMKRIAVIWNHWKKWPYLASILSSMYPMAALTVFMVKWICSRRCSG